MLWFVNSLFSSVEIASDSLFNLLHTSKEMIITKLVYSYRKENEQNNILTAVCDLTFKPNLFFFLITLPIIHSDSFSPTL